MLLIRENIFTYLLKNSGCLELKKMLLLLENMVKDLLKDCLF